MEKDKVITVVEDRPEDVPETWTVWNAPRPLSGNLTWIGDFVSGRFYAAIDPDGDFAEAMIEQNRESQAVILEYVTEAEWRKRVYKHAETFAALFLKRGMDVKSVEFSKLEQSYRDVLSR